MTILDFKVLCLSKSMGRVILPENTLLFPKIFTALKRVAKDTIPLRLKVEDDVGEQILRRLDEFAFIRFPRTPRLEDDVLDIDDALLDAVALFTMASIEFQRAKQYMGLYYTEIELNNERLVETYLEKASNDSPNTDSTQRFA